MDNLEFRIHEKVVKISEEIGERNMYFYENLKKAAEYIADEFNSYGYKADFQRYFLEGKPVENIIAEKKGEKYPEEIFIVGAHYDSAPGTPGADDNGSAVAVLLELAYLFSAVRTGKTVRFAAFGSEEPPYFGSRLMGSRIYARECRIKRENILGMISLECIGFYTRESRKRALPSRIAGLLHPQAGNFLALVGAPRYRVLTGKITEEFRKYSGVKVLSVALPRIIPGMDWSDHGSFWREGYPALMATDTAFYRNPHYHRPTDTWEKLNYPFLAEITRGFYHSVFSLVK